MIPLSRDMRIWDVSHQHCKTLSQMMNTILIARHREADWNKSWSRWNGYYRRHKTLTNVQRMSSSSPDSSTKIMNPVDIRGHWPTQEIHGKQTASEVKWILVQHNTREEWCEASWCSLWESIVITVWLHEGRVPSLSTYLRPSSIPTLLTIMLQMSVSSASAIRKSLGQSNQFHLFLWAVSTKRMICRFSYRRLLRICKEHRSIKMIADFHVSGRYEEDDW